MGGVVDSLGRQISLRKEPTRIVSLVPSETHSVATLSSPARLIGRTTFCELPTQVLDVECVGGTKDFDVEKVIALSPDLVLCNKEENSRPRVQALIDAQLPVHVSFPQNVRGSIDYLHALCSLLGLNPTCLHEQEHVYSGFSSRVVKSVKVFVPIWKGPWMSFNEYTYAHDVLELVGGRNIFSDRARRYPLRADLGASAAKDAKDKDTRYPRMSLEEIIERAPELVLLPDEPYAFSEEDKAELQESLPNASIRFINGKDLFWYGCWTQAGLERLSQLLSDS